MLGAGAGIVVTLLDTPKYEAQAKLYVSVRTDSQASGDLLQGSNVARENMTTFVELTTTESVLAPVAEELDLDAQVRQLAEQIKLLAPAEYTHLRIRSSDTNTTHAASV